MTPAEIATQAIRDKAYAPPEPWPPGAYFTLGALLGTLVLGGGLWAVGLIRGR